MTPDEAKERADVVNEIEKDLHPLFDDIADARDKLQDAMKKYNALTMKMTKTRIAFYESVEKP